MRSEELQDSTLALQHFYEIDAVRDRDALGTFCAATAQPFGRPVQVWVLDRLAQMGVSGEILDRIEKTAYATSRLQASANARLLDAGRLDGTTPFIVFDAVEGQSLREHVGRQGPLPIWQALRIVEQLGALLSEAHENGLSRSALDADRVVVVDTASARVRFYGFGIAMTRPELLGLDDAIVDLHLMRHIPPADFDDPRDKAHGPDAANTARDNTSPAITITDDAETKPGDDRTTTPFQNDASPDEAADIYALAALVYECLSARHPYFLEGRDVGDGVLAILRESPAPLDAIADVDTNTAAVIAKALGRNVGSEYPTVQAFVAAFRHTIPQAERARADAAARPGWLGEDVVLPQHAMTRARRGGAYPRLVRGLAAAVVVLALACVGILFFSPQGSVTRSASVPEFVPPAPEGEGVDVVIETGVPSTDEDPFSPTRPAELDLYIVSTRGDTDYVGRTPYVLRAQREGAKLRFVLSADDFKPQQFDVVVRDDGDQVMFVRERVHRVDGRHAGLTSQPR